MHYVETYNASEGFFGIQGDLSDPAMLLTLDMYFLRIYTDERDRKGNPTVILRMYKQIQTMP
jgi:hypothetical protein